MSARDVLIRCVDSCLFNGDSGDIADAVLREFTAAGYVIEQGWQDISTAPRDGTIILVTGCNGGDLVLAAHYREDGPYGDEGWWGWSLFGLEAVASPTDWRPLPARPPGR